MMDTIIIGSLSPTGVLVASGGRGPAGKANDDVQMLKPRHLDAFNNCNFDNLFQAFLEESWARSRSPG